MKPSWQADGIGLVPAGSTASPAASIASGNQASTNPTAQAFPASAARFDGKTVLINGGGGGVGRSAALLFAADSARVGVIDRDARAGRAVVDEIEAAGGQAVFAEADVSSEGELNRAISTALDFLGPVNILFNHAGSVTPKPFLETTDSDWRALLDVNLMSMVRTTRVVLPPMIEAGGGAIVNTSSVSALLASALESVYCVTKAAVLQLTRAITAEFRDRGIRCNAICPAAIRTEHGRREIEQLKALGADWSDEAITAGQVRMCEPEEVARVAVFLASEAASFINGAAIVVDNGWTVVT